MEWTTFVTIECASGPAECLEVLSCAEPLKTCDFTGFLTCFTGGQMEDRAAAAGILEMADPFTHPDAKQKRKS